jgi:tripartite motif-containing protein 71
MASGLRLCVICLGLWAAGLCSGSDAWAEGSGVLGGSGGSPSESALVTPGPQFVGGEGLAAAEEVSRSNPEAVLEREASRTRYEGLGGGEAVALAQASFPVVLDSRGGGPPQLPAGDAITGFVDGTAAEISLGEGQRGVIESSEPMAIASSPGHWAAVDLGLSEGSGGFGMTNPLVELVIPKRLGEGGIGVPGSEISVVPVDGSGIALGGSEGVLAGSAVVYANTQRDTDTVIKPTTFGFDAIGLLRSEQSPQELDYKLSLPAGASLVQEASTSLVRVVKEGSSIGIISPPSAHDAAGTPVPVKMSVTGDTVAVDVAARSGSYEYPIEVDPEYFNTTTEASSTYGNWHFFETERGGYTYSKASGRLAISHNGGYGEGDLAYWAFETKGESKVYKVEVADELYPEVGKEGKWGTYAFLQAALQIRYGESEIHSVLLSGWPSYLKSASVCANEACYPSEIHKENEAWFWLDTVETSKRFEEKGETYNIPFGGSLSSATVYLAQPQGLHSTVSYNTSSLEVGGQTNVFANGGHWFGPSSGAFEFTARDIGLGVAETNVEYYSGGSWNFLHRHNFLTESAFCTGVECSESQSEVLTYHSIGMSNLPEGSDQLRVAARDADGNTWSSEYGEGQGTIKVDATPPHGLKLSGLAVSGEELELGEVEGHVQLEASDGEGTVSSSGVKSIALAIDGKETGKQAGSCAEGPCTAKGEVTINGAELGVGRHTLTVKATDNAGNIATKAYVLNVYAASPVALGPGSVNPESGDYAMEASDVNISGGSGVLAVTRHYDSRNVSEGIESPLGPQWTLSLGSLASLEVLPDGSVMVAGPDGLTHFTTKTGGGFEAPVGDTNFTLEYEPKEKEYLLKDPAKGTTTSFTLPAGAKSWMPTVSKGPVATDTMTDTYQTAEPEAGKKIVEPTLELAPHPSATCEPKKTKEEPVRMKEGCRALEFAYGEATKATGESQSQWGEYKGRLKTVTFIAFNPTAKKMVATPVAEYVYDGKGRLRSEWNPQTPELKTDYGYDATGHITAVTAPGVQPWIFDYGSIASDVSAGRLIALTRPSASTAAGNGVLPQNTAAPVISGSPTISSTLTVSQGTWSNSPVSYGYQWEKCSSSGGSCALIPGATNATYVPETGSVEHKLVVQVTATNMDGSTTAASAALLIPKPTRFFSAPIGKTGNGAGQFLSPEGEAIDSKGDLWVVDKNNNRIEELSSTGVYIAAYGKEGSGEVQFKKPTGIEINPSTGNLFVTDTGNNRVEVLTPKGEYVTAFGGKEGPGQLSEPTGIAYFGNDVYVADTGNNRIVVFTVSGVYVTAFGSKGAGKTEFMEPEGVATSIVEGGVCLYVADKGNNRLQVLGLEGGTHKFEGSFGSKGSGSGQFNAPVGVVGSEGTIDVVDSGNGRVEILAQRNSCVFDEEHVAENIEYVAAFGSKGSGSYGQFGSPQWIAEQTTGSRRGDLYIGDSEKNRIIEASETAFAELPEPLPPAPSTGTNSQWTVEYGVPLEGTEAPHQMGLNKLTGEPEPEKWAQTDDPVYASAIFPPDRPMGWPAIEYKHETVYYLDHQARTVNVAGPAGGISTAEYNANNEVQRSLSPDNRALALEPREGTSQEKALLLDTKSVYTSEGQLVETRGPQHTVKLAVGKEKPDEEVLARNHIRYYYNEGAPESESFDLVTRTIDGAETASGEEFDKRTSLTAYGGQNGLGWKLREPTSTMTDPAGLDLMSTTEYNEATGDVIETKAPGGTSQAVSPPVFSSVIGSEGSEGGKFSHPQAVAVGSGNLWVADTGNSRVEEFSSSNGFIAAYGSSGTGVDQFSKPGGIAVNPSTSNVYVSDTANNRIDELSSTGAFIEAFGWGVNKGYAGPEVCTTKCLAAMAGSSKGELDAPMGITIDAEGNIWVAEQLNNRIQEFSASGAYISQFASKGSGAGQLEEPDGVAISEGEIYVADSGNDRIEEFSPAGGYLAQFGSEGTGQGQFKEPTGIATNTSTGDLYVSDASNFRVQEFTPAGKFLAEFGKYGSQGQQFHTPRGIALKPNGKIYIADAGNSRLAEWSPPGTGGAHVLYSTQFGSSGSGNGAFSDPRAAAVDGHGDLWVTDASNHRIEEFSAAGKFLAAYGSSGMGKEQFGQPSGIDVNQSTGNVYIADWTDNRIQELSSTGAFIRLFSTYGTEPGEVVHPGGLTIDSSGNIWVADTGNNRIEEFSWTGSFIAAYGSAGSGNGQFKEPWGIKYSAGKIYVSDHVNNRIEELSTEGVYEGQFGVVGDGGGQFKGPEGIAADSAGNLYVIDQGNSRVEEFNASGTFLESFAAAGSGEGQLNEPEGIAVNAAGDVYVVDSGNNRIEEWAPVEQAVHDTKTIYYTSEANSEYPGCGGHIEWANLPCQTRPVSQPTDNPKLPITTLTYNMWDQVETTEEQFKESIGTTKREQKTTFDAAGRPLSTEETSSIDTPLPTVTDKYNTTNGTLETQSTTSGSTTETITSLYNTLGQPESYTDADKNTAKYEYDIDGRVTMMSDSSNKGESNQTYSYSPTTGALTQLVDSAAGTFTATYDVQGRMTSESYPNGMTAYYTYNPAGSETGIEYQKLTHCTEKCTWFSDNITPGIHGETLKQTSTLSEEPNYTYDPAGRLTQVQEIPVGEGCTTRAYGYNEEGDRMSLTASKPNSKGECATEEPSTQRHTYDEANRLTDENITYEPFGNTTKLPEADAGGESELTSTFYVDNQVDLERQGEKSNEYELDPEGRTRETITKTGKPGKETETKTITHYDAPGGTLAWTSETPEKWTRNIPGIGGELAAIQTDPGTTTLQLHDLQGNIIAEASTSETETKLLKTYNSTEFGVPNNKTTPPKYAWLGATGIASELPSGTITQDGNTYVPQTGQPLQTQGIYIPAATNAYTAYTSTANPWTAAAIAYSAQQVTLARQQRAAEERASGGGVAPSSYCNEEVEGCGPDPEHGHNISGCRAWASWGYGVFGPPALYGHFECRKYVEHIEVEVAVQLVIEGGLEGGVYKQIKAGKEAWSDPHGEKKFAINFECTGGKEYRGWYWARQYVAGLTYWTEEGLDGRLFTCPQSNVNQGPDDMEEEDYSSADGGGGDDGDD